MKILKPVQAVTLATIARTSVAETVLYLRYVTGWQDSVMVDVKLDGKKQLVTQVRNIVNNDKFSFKNNGIN